MKQTYQVLRIELKDGGTFDFTKGAQVFMLSRRDKKSAIIGTQRGGAKAHPSTLDDKVKCIEYRVSVEVNGKEVSEDFYHKFKIRPWLSMFGQRFGVIEPDGGKLFTTRPLNLMMGSKQFGRARGLQFCC